MKVASQIKARMEQLGVSVPELSKRLKCSQQTVRYWMTGRNLPKKARATALEEALSFSIDWSEGSRQAGRPSAQALMDQNDVELLLKISRLPVRVKVILGTLADAINEGGISSGPARREVGGSMEPFVERRKQGVVDAKQRGRKAAGKAA